MAASSRLSQGCRTAFGQAVTPSQADAAVGRVEQRQDLGRAVAEVLVRLPRRLALGPPGLAGVGDRLVRPGLVGAPDRQPHRLAGAVGVLDQLFFGIGVRVGDDRRPGLAAAQGRAGRAPGAGALVAGPGLVEDAADGVGRDPGQAVGGRAERPPQGRERPGRGAVGLGGRRPGGLGRRSAPGPAGRRSAAARRRGGASGRPGPRR